MRPKVTLIDDKAKIRKETLKKPKRFTAKFWGPLSSCPFGPLALIITNDPTRNVGRGPIVSSLHFGP